MPVPAHRARERTRHPQARFLIADVCTNNSWADGRFDAAACRMAADDVEAIDKMFLHLGQALKPGGRAGAHLHAPASASRASRTGAGTNKKIQYRRLDRYGVPLAIPVTTHRQARQRIRGFITGR